MYEIQLTDIEKQWLRLALNLDEPPNPETALEALKAASPEMVYKIATFFLTRIPSTPDDC